MRQEESPGKGFGWDLLKESPWGPQSLKGGQPTLLECELPSFLNDQLYRVLCVGIAFVIPFIFTSLQSRLQVG